MSLLRPDVIKQHKPNQTTFHYIIYVPASLHTAAKGDFAATASN